MSEGPARRVMGLAFTFATSKLLLLSLRLTDGGSHFAVSFLTPFVMLHQDAIFVLVWAAVDLAISHRSSQRWERTALALYAGVALYAAINMPIALRLSTPLTNAMFGAVGRALAGSIWKYVTFKNVIAVGLVLAAAGAPFVLPRPSRRFLLLGAGASAVVAVVGTLSARNTETLGLHRNAIVALAATSLEKWRVAQKLDTTLRRSRLPDEGPAEDLTFLRGRAAGRNVVWVLLESTGARYVGPYGKTPDPTPNLSALAAESIVFEAVHCAIPDSIRGLFSMLCSIAPRPHVAVEQYAAGRAPCESIASTLAQAGYRTAFFHSGRFRYIGMQGIVDDRGFDELYDAESIHGAYESSFGIDDASTVKRLLTFVDSVRAEPGKRFFAVYSPIAGHHPYRSPGPSYGSLPGNTDLELYLNDLSTGDVAFGALVAGIRARGLFENTLFIVVGDHGQAFQQHPGNFGHTLFVYEENTHVPFIVVAPGLVKGNPRAPQVGSLLDMAPTTLALLGIAPVPAHQGRSLLDPISGVARFMTDHDVLKAGLRHDHFKLLYESEYQRFRLFDVRADPGEKRDLSESEPARTALYKDDVLNWLGPR